MFMIVLVGSLRSFDKKLVISRKFHFIDFVDFLPLTTFNWVRYIYFWYVLFVKKKHSNLPWHLVS